MPKIKTKRTDILRTFEIKKMLEQSEPWLQCLIAIAWIFGKRINEILKVTKEDIFIREGYLYIRFTVSKRKLVSSETVIGEDGKPHRKLKLEPLTPKFTKRITLRNPYVKYILDYISTIQEGQVFPNMSRQLAHYYLKKVNPKAWFHLFRHSLATEMSERGATEEKLMNWFDWDRVETAHNYVKRGTKLTEEYSERTW